MSQRRPKLPALHRAALYTLVIVVLAVVPAFAGTAAGSDGTPDSALAAPTPPPQGIPITFTLTTSPMPTDTGGSHLPTTGTDIVGLVAVGVFSIVGGVIVLMLAGRRRTKQGNV
jgi:LPXTG-motif cell wall-anchored protein